jgi:ribonuclease P protein component
MPRLRFSRAARLGWTAEFARVRAEGRSVHGKFMVLTVLRLAAAEPSRAGFITSRRVGGAVQRNRVRRRLREIVRADRPRVEPGFWFTLVARAAAAKASFANLRDEWRHLAKSSGLLVLDP